MRCSYWLFGILAIVVSTLGVTTATYAQVNGTGPSDPALFDDVLNVSDSSVRSLPEIPDGETLQVNLFEGGSITNRRFFPVETAISGVEVNVDGGSFEGVIDFGAEGNIVDGRAAFTVNSGGQANILGGDSLVWTDSGSDVNVTGGRISIAARSGGLVRVSGGSFANLNLPVGGIGFDGEIVLSGGEFALNGNPISGSSIEFAERDVLTGTLEDGSALVLGPYVLSPFTSTSGALSRLTNLSGGGNRISLNAVPLSAVNLTPIVVNTPNPDIPFGLRAGQTLTLQDGGRLEGGFQVVGATLSIEGGSLGDSLGAETNIAVDSNVNVSGGVVAEFLLALNGTVVNVTGGEIVSLIVDQDSQANVSGGAVSGLTVGEDGHATISGGRFGNLTLSSGTTELVGGEFKLNGENFDGATITLDIGDEFTGTFADGSPFILNSAAFAVFDDYFFGQDVIVETVLSRVALPEIDTTPVVVDTTAPEFSSGLRAGQELTLVEGGQLGAWFGIVDATLNVEGGILGPRAIASRSEVNVSGGNVGSSFTASAGSVVNISGGTVGIFFNALTDSVVNISGGEIDPAFQINSGSEVNLFGTEFFLDGVAVDFVDGESITILDRDVKITGTLLDGTSFEFDLSGVDFGFLSFFSSEATLTLNRGSVEPSVVGDVNGDGFVDFLDISPFISALSTGEFQSEADINEDDQVNFLDISPFIGLLIGQ